MDPTSSLEFSEQDLIGIPFSGYEDYSQGLAPDRGTEYICKSDTAVPWLFQTMFQPLVYILVFLLGLTGNSLMLIVLLKRRGQLRVTEIYLLHLGLADLMLLFTFPFALVQIVGGWVFGNFLCKLVGLLNRLNFLCGSLLLACIGFDRYLAVVHAIPSMQIRHPRTVHVTCVFLWLICLGLSAPNIAFLSVIEYPTNSSQLTCYSHSYGIHANNWLLTNRLMTHLFGFFIPLAVMIYCYSAIVFTLHRRHRSRQQQGAIRLALVVTVVFCLCWLPFNVTMVVIGVISYQSCEEYAGLKQALIITESLGLSHCCLNPVLYAFVGTQFRNELLRLFSTWGRRRLSRIPFETQGRSSTSEAVTSSSHFT